MGKEGVSASVSKKETGGRDETGRWLPGTSGNPRGRPNKEEELRILDSIRSTFTPEEIQQHLRDAMDTAIANKSTRGMVAVLEYIHDRTIGKPVQRLIQETDSFDDMLERLKEIG